MERKIQYNLWVNLDKKPGTEIHNLINRASGTMYIIHYKNLESNYFYKWRECFSTFNRKFYEDSWKNIIDANDQNTKLKIYHQIYNDCENLPETRLSLKSKVRKRQKLVLLYDVLSQSRNRKG